MVMTLSPELVSKWAETLDQARLNAREMERITTNYAGLTLEEAYRIQAQGIELRCSRHGEKVVGYKMGLTSKAKREQMGLHSPVYGVLTEQMQVQDGGTYRLQGQIHPKIEPEIAFLVGRELKGRITLAEALASCDAVCPAMEILDSRYVGFKYFSLPDVVADNSSSSQFVLGPWVRDFSGLDLAHLPIQMFVGGQLAQSAPSSAISDHPGNSLVQLCELLAPLGLGVPAGSIVMAGAATVAVALEPGMKVHTEIESLGRVSVKTA